VTLKWVSQQILLSGFGGRKAPSSMGQISTVEVLRLRAISPLLNDRSAMRFVQDDGPVGVLKNLLLGCANKKVTTSRDDKVEGGGPPWQWRTGIDRVSTQATNPVSFARVPFNPA
jgi:hypothetical protein